MICVSYAIEEPCFQLGISRFRPAAGIGVGTILWLAMFLVGELTATSTTRTTGMLDGTPIIIRRYDDREPAGHTSVR